MTNDELVKEIKASNEAVMKELRKSNMQGNLQIGFLVLAFFLGISSVQSLFTKFQSIVKK